ncbi:MAG: hypothetical protein HY277_01700 [Ignavibacteriales bacterium]|nr:hypothetical protein [Ignavibacteriales bacterium]
MLPFCRRSVLLCGRYPSWRWPWQDWIGTGGIILAAISYLAFPQGSINGERDTGVYASEGIFIANHGTMDVPYPYSPADSALLNPVFEGFPGFYKTQPTMTMQFAHLFPVWLAEAYGSFGLEGLIRLNGVLAVLAVCVFYGFCARVMPRSFALTAALLFAFNPGQMWLARVTLTEIMAQLVVWSGLSVWLLALNEKDVVLARVAGFILGVSAIVRVDGFLVVPLLFAANVLFRFTAGENDPRTSKIWLALYSSLIPVAFLALVYFVLFSNPYFSALAKQVRLIGIMSLAGVLVLLIVTWARLDRFRVRKFSTAIIVLGCVTMVTLAVYAYWIRPHGEPFSVISWPGHPLDGTRDYRENSLVNLAPYVSPVVIWLAVAGWCFLFWKIIQSVEHTKLATAFVLLTGSSLAYLWNPSIAPDHFWAIRRFMPVIIPGFILIAALAVHFLHIQFRQKVAAFIPTAVAAYLLVFTVLADTPLFFVGASKGDYYDLATLANLLPPNEIVLSHNGTSFATWETPLFAVFDRKIVPLDLNSPTEIAAVHSLVRKANESYKPLRLLHESTLPRGLAVSGVNNLVLHRSYYESTLQPLPRKVVAEDKIVWIYQIDSLFDSYNNVTMGSELVFGVQESGFEGTEHQGGIATRWTSGSAKLSIPIAPLHKPKWLQLELDGIGPPGRKFTLFADSVVLTNQGLPQSGLKAMYSLADVPLRDTLTLDLICDTFVPSTIYKGSNDDRTLGVSVRSVRLRESDSSYSRNRLSEYRSVILPIDFSAGVTVSPTKASQLAIFVMNTSQAIWPAPADVAGYEGSVRIGILWFTKGDSVRPLAESRAELPCSLFPSDEVQVSIPITIPKFEGRQLPPDEYVVMISLLQEGVVWFYQKGGGSLKIPVRIRPS